MIGQYLPNNHETATVAFRQKFCQLNSLYISLLLAICSSLFVEGIYYADPT
jgi:hypothetical protein